MFWFTVEFGVSSRERASRRRTARGCSVRRANWSWFADHAEIRPLDIVRWARSHYDIDHYQPVLFAGRSLTHVHDVVGGFLATATDESIAALSDPTYTGSARRTQPAPQR